MNHHLPHRLGLERSNRLWFFATILLSLVLVTPSTSLFAAVHAQDPPESVAGDSENPKNHENPKSLSPATPEDTLVSSNLLAAGDLKAPTRKVIDYQHKINTARQLRREKETAGAAKMLVGVLQKNPPPEFKRAALFELALIAQDEQDLSRAQQIFAQYIQLFPQDPSVPEVLLRQGLILREMGAHRLAIAKFYAVMNMALSLKMDEFKYYRRLVLQAQTEIADTYYLQGKFDEAADFFARLLKQDTFELNRAQVHFKLIRSLARLDNHVEVVTQCKAFFDEFPDAPETAELRFTSATALKKLGRKREAVLQVFKLLESQAETSDSNPDSWVYWQQRAGNEIANQLYLEGDYLNALEIYKHLAALSDTVPWQLPVWYQIGLIQERLQQPQKALETFKAIAAREQELTGSEDTPTLKTVVEMAKWRRDHIQWRRETELSMESLRLNPVPVPPAPQKQRAATTP
jgi:tetratricopeptide (TPR) repeat protein